MVWQSMQKMINNGKKLEKIFTYFEKENYRNQAQTISFNI